MEFFYEESKQVFRYKFYQILESPDSEAQAEFKSAERQFENLLRQYRRSVLEHSPRTTWACLCLANVPLDLVRGVIDVDELDEYSDFEDMERLAPRVYHEFSTLSLEEAQKALRSVWPEVYDQVAGFRNYELMIDAYTWIMDQPPRTE